MIHIAVRVMLCLVELDHIRSACVGLLQTFAPVLACTECGAKYKIRYYARSYGTTHAASPISNRLFMSHLISHWTCPPLIMPPKPLGFVLPLPLPPLYQGVSQSSGGSGTSRGVAQGWRSLCFRCASPGLSGHPVHVRPSLRPPALPLPVEPRADSGGGNEPQASGGSGGLLQVPGGGVRGGHTGRGVLGGHQGRREVRQGTEVRTSLPTCLLACLPACLPVGLPAVSFCCCHLCERSLCITTVYHRVVFAREPTELTGYHGLETCKVELVHPGHATDDVCTGAARKVFFCFVGHDANASVFYGTAVVPRRPSQAETLRDYGRLREPRAKFKRQG